MPRNSGGGVDWGTFAIIVFIVAALGGGGGGLSSCSASGNGGGNTPAPKTSQVCNEYFKGGC